MSLAESIKRSFPTPSSPQLRQLAWVSFVSSLGSTFQVFAFTYVTYATTKSAFATVMVGVSFAVAYSLVAVPSGVVARRFDHRHVVVAVSISKALVYAVILVLELLGDLSLAAILVSSAVSGVTSSIQYPCWQELLQRFSSKGTLDETNALFSSLSSVSSVAGALAGGLLLDSVGVAPLFAFNVLSYLPQVVVVARLPAPAKGPGAARKAAGKASASVKRAYAAISGSSAVRRAVLFTALLELLAWPLISLMPKIAADVGSSATIYGLLLAAFYLGSALVAVLLRRWKRDDPYSHIIRLSTTASGCALVIAGAVGIAPFGPALTVAGLAVVLAAAGLGLSTAQSVLGAITQLGVPKKVEGEVLGLFALITIGFGTAGSLVEGALADKLNVWWIPLVSGAAVVIAMNIAWLRKGFLPLNAADPDSPRGRTYVARHAQSSVGGDASPLVLHLRRPLASRGDDSAD